MQTPTTGAEGGAEVGEEEEEVAAVEEDTQ